MKKQVRHDEDKKSKVKRSSTRSRHQGSSNKTTKPLSHAITPSDINPAIQRLFQSMKSESKGKKKIQARQKEFFNPNPQSASPIPTATNKTDSNKPPLPPPKQVVINTAVASQKSLPLKRSSKSSKLNVVVSQKKKEVAVGSSDVDGMVQKVKKTSKKAIHRRHSSSDGKHAAAIQTKSNKTSSSTNTNTKTIKKLAKTKVSSKTQATMETLRRRDSSASADHPHPHRRIYRHHRRSKSKSASRTNLNPRKSSVTVLEAAAKLSFPWPAPSIYEQEQTPAQKRSRFLKDIHQFFETHKEFLEIPDVRSAYEKSKGFSNPNKVIQDGLDESVMDSLKLAFRQYGIPTTKLGKEYKPVVAPQWEKVETSWPGFDHKPRPNWQNFATPSKIATAKKKGIMKSGGGIGGGPSTSKSGLKVEIKEDDTETENTTRGKIVSKKLKNKSKQRKRVIRNKN